MKSENIQITALSDLVSILQYSNIDISKWGKGEAKTIEHLLQEILEGESKLFFNEEGKLIREIEASNGFVYYQVDESTRLKLIEDKQVFIDGRVRSRRDRGFSIAEKIKPGEDPSVAFSRCINEELNIYGDFNLMVIPSETKFLESMSYPGLWTCYLNHQFEVFLNKEQFSPDGYIEKQDDLTTYFVWEEG